MLAMDAIRKPKVFINYARKDNESVMIIYGFLQEMGFAPWIDYENIEGGGIWGKDIQNAIRDSDFFLVCLSPNAVNRRGVIQKEIKAALEKNQEMLEGDRFIIPVRLAPCQLPENLSKFQVIDLYSEGSWDKLSRNLKAESERRLTSKSQPHDPNTIPSPLQPPTYKICRSKRNWVLAFLTLLVIFVTPLIYNNFFHRVEAPELPVVICQIDNQQIEVGIANLPSCPSDTVDQLIEAWNDESTKVYGINTTISSPIDAQFLTNLELDMVVWGSCSEEMLEINFVTDKIGAPVEVYAPISLEYSGDLPGVVSTGQALFAYQSGQFATAAEQFSKLEARSSSADLALFEANSWLFDQKYDRATKIYHEITKTIDPASSAAYNNLGVVLNNTAQPEDLKYAGLQEFSQAIVHAENNDEQEIALLAYVNRAMVYMYGSNWEHIEADCNRAMQINAATALPHLCWARYSFSYYPQTNLLGSMPLGTIDQSLSEAEMAGDNPMLTSFIRIDWHLAHTWKQKQEAVNAYANLYQSMENSVCLRNDWDRLRKADRLIKSSLKE